jgi:hypothetical protein
MKSGIKLSASASWSGSIGLNERSAFSIPIDSKFPCEESSPVRQKDLSYKTFM